MSGWELETGGLDNFTLTVERAWFGTDERYNGGQSLLINWAGPTDLDDPRFKEEFTVSFSVGAGWLTDDGKTAYHGSGQEGKGFRKTSMYGIVIQRALNDFGIGAELQKRGDPTNATVWEGLSFKMLREDVDFGRGVISKDRLMPVAVVSAGASAQVTASVAVVDLEAQLSALAQTSTSHQAFVDEAVKLPGVSADKTLLEKIVNPDGFYAEARS